MYSGTCVVSLLSVVSHMSRGPEVISLRCWDNRTNMTYASIVLIIDSVGISVRFGAGRKASPNILIQASGSPRETYSFLLPSLQQLNLFEETKGTLGKH